MARSDDAARLRIPVESDIRDAVSLLDRRQEGIVLVTDRRGRLVGTITDGDIRRAILARIDFSEPVLALLKRKRGTRFYRPITAAAGTPAEACLDILKKHSLSHLPLVDAAGRVRGLVRLNDFVSDEAGLQAVVMAGGKGARLYPLTKNTPKPMLRVGGRPVMEILLRKLKSAGIRRVHVTTHYKPAKIERHFGDGRGLGVDLAYVNEARPLGTAGALALLQRPRGTMLVVNGDILTEVDFRAMQTFHREERADFTVGVRRYDIEVPYGVVSCDGPRVLGLDEKPTMDFLVSAGIYLLEPSIFRYIPRGRRYEMTDLIRRAIRAGRRVASFPIREYWIDIGRQSDYAAADRRARGRPRR